MDDGTMSVRLFADRDLPAVLELLKDSLGETASLRRTPELFGWKHFDNPFGRSLMLVSHIGPTITGFRAFMRWELNTPDGRTLRCVRAVDTATHADFRRRGIFKTLTLAAIDAATDDGVDLIFNTPNPRSGAGYLKMGWSEVGLLRPIASPAKGILRRGGDPDALPVPSDFIEPATAVGPRITPDRDPLGLRTPRSTDYHAWRFTSHPTARYVQVDRAGATAIARLAFRGSRRELLVSDVYGDGMRQAINRCRRVAKTSYVGAFFSKGTPERAAATRAGLIQVPRAGLTLMVRPLRELGIDVKRLSTWDLSLSDLELL
ncbi:MAG: GNAT family N-acetyltransferase [Actinomycetota bacterium]